MAVIAVWKCDRDGSMFNDKKLADAHDKMLELAESIMQLIETNLTHINEQDAEAIGLLLAKNSDNLVKACKGKPEVLLSINSDADNSDVKAATETNSEPKPSLKKVV